MAVRRGRRLSNKRLATRTIAEEIAKPVTRGDEPDAHSVRRGPVLEPIVSDGPRLVSTQRLWPMIGLSVGNFLLSIITLTVWRFWGRSLVRRRLWRNTRLLDDAFEYTGEPRDLYAGFVAVVATAFIGSFLLTSLQILALEYAALVILCVYFLIQNLASFAIFSATRYRLAHTRWRNIRLHLSGSAIRYALIAFGYQLLVYMSLGWFAPARKWRLAARIWSGIEVGDDRFRFEGKPRGLYGWFALRYFGATVAAIATIAFVGFLVSIWRSNQSLGGEQVDLNAELGALFEIFGARILLFPIILAIFLFFWSFVSFPYLAKFHREIISCLRFQGLSFELTAGPWKIFKFALINRFLVVFSLGVLTPVAQARLFHFLATHVRATGSSDLTMLRANTKPPGSMGEGLAEALDFGTVI